MRYVRSLLVMVALAAFALVGLPRPVAAAEDLAGLIPPGAEIAASLNVKTLVETGFLRKLVEKSGNKKVDAQLNLFRNLTGIDVFGGDLERVSLFGSVGKDDEHLIAFEGRFDQTKLVDLLKVNDQYEESTIAGQKAYQWFDKGENRLKFGAFTSAGTALISGSRASIEAALNKGVDRSQSEVASEFKKLSSGAKGSTALMAFVLVPKDKVGKNFPAAEQLHSLSGTVDVTETTMSVAATANLLKADKAQQWLDLARGVLALAALQGDKPAVAELARRTQVTMEKDKNGGDRCALIGQVTVDEALVDGLMNETKKEPK